MVPGSNDSSPPSAGVAVRVILRRAGETGPEGSAAGDGVLVTSGVGATVGKSGEAGADGWGVGLSTIALVRLQPASSSVLASDAIIKTARS
jgi:hypothetical protein